MPIPRFTDEGLLPPGLYLAALDEVVARFGGFSMSITDECEYQMTQGKLAGVRETIARIEHAPLSGSAAARAASLRSLRAYENQLVEELVRYETRQGWQPRALVRPT